MTDTEEIIEVADETEETALVATEPQKQEEPKEPKASWLLALLRKYRRHLLGAGVGVLAACMFMWLGFKIGKENFLNYFEAFGFTDKTGIDLPGESDSIYHSRENLGIVDLAVYSFGQNFSITPIQMVTACSAIARTTGFPCAVSLLIAANVCPGRRASTSPLAISTAAPFVSLSSPVQ